MVSSTTTGKHRCGFYCQNSFAIAGAKAYEQMKRGEEIADGKPSAFSEEAQILPPALAWHQAGAGQALVLLGEHKRDVSFCLPMSPCHAFITRIIPLFPNKEAGQIHFQAGLAV